MSPFANLDDPQIMKRMIASASDCMLCKDPDVRKQCNYEMITSRLFIRASCFSMLKR